MSGQGESLASVTPDNIRIPHKNKIKKTPDTSIMIKEHILDIVNPKKRAKEFNVTDVEK